MNYKSRQEKLFNVLKEKNVNAYLTNDPANMEYFTGMHTTTIPPKELFMLAIEDKLYVISPSLEADYCKLMCSDCEIVEWKFSQKLDEIISNLLKKHIIIGYENNTLNYHLLAKLRKKHYRFRWIREAIRSLRMIKDPFEINNIKLAIKATEKALKVAKELIEKGDYTEKEIAKEVHIELIKNGCEGVSFDPIIATGKNATFPHYNPSGIKLKNDDFTLVDIGGRYASYCADLTRTFLRGKINDKKERLFNEVKNAIQLAINEVREGKSCKELDLVARNYLKNKGLDSYFIHSLGHGIGLEIHELPTISYRSENILKAGMVITIEPGIYIKDEVGIRLEDDVLVQKEKGEVLSTFPLEY